MEYVKISVEDSGIGVPLLSRCDLFQVIYDMIDSDPSLMSLQHEDGGGEVEDGEH